METTQQYDQRSPAGSSAPWLNERKARRIHRLLRGVWVLGLGVCAIAAFGLIHRALPSGAGLTHPSAICAAAPSENNSPEEAEGVIGMEAERALAVEESPRSTNDLSSEVLNEIISVESISGSNQGLRLSGAVAVRISNNAPARVAAIDILVTQLRKDGAVIKVETVQAGGLRAGASKVIVFPKPVIGHQLRYEIIRISPDADLVALPTSL